MSDEQPVDLDVVACLAQAYGVEPPRRVVELAQRAFEHATREGFVNDTDYLSFGGLAFDLAGLAQRPVWPECDPYGYSCTPPELFVFGSPGVDGIHYGFVVHAPQLRPHPLGVLNPMNPERGVRALGATEEETASLLGPGPSEAPVFDPAWPVVEPSVPDGWRYEPTSDGVGVLAPEHAFGDAPSIDVGHYAVLAPVERAATVALMQGHAATSLWVLREFFANNHGGDAVSARAALRLMAQAYRALDRPLLAEIALGHGQRHWPTG
ncbi:MAG: hypothetical protein KUG77_14570 [Nannocystaceae bacterium]|nr:hypothetical protein [Nannocystaceae bacterium]